MKESFKRNSYINFRNTGTELKIFNSREGKGEEGGKGKG
jgi:hypothetical protein